jgi:hypothetical protein
MLLPLKTRPCFLIEALAGIHKDLEPDWRRRGLAMDRSRYPDCDLKVAPTQLLTSIY